MKRQAHNQKRHRYNHESHNSSYKSLIQENLASNNILRFPQETASPVEEDPLTDKELQIARARLWVRGLLTPAENIRIVNRIERRVK
jgi:hypothetical protein